MNKLPHHLNRLSFPNPIKPVKRAPVLPSMMKPTAAASPSAPTVQRVAGKPVAPPVYRPQPVPKVLQAKSQKLGGANPSSQRSDRSFLHVMARTYDPVAKKIIQPRTHPQMLRSLHSGAADRMTPEYGARPITASVVQKHSSPMRSPFHLSASAPLNGQVRTPVQMMLRNAPLSSLRGQAKPFVAQAHKPKADASQFTQPKTRQNLSCRSVVQAKYDVHIEVELSEESQKTAKITKLNIEDRPAYPDVIKGVFEFGKKNEKGHTVAWDVIKLHHERKYIGKQIQEVANDLNSDTKKAATGGAVRPTIESVREGFKRWIEYKHKQETIYWDQSGQNTPRGSFFRGVKDEYIYYKNNPTKQDAASYKKLFQELMVVSAIDFQSKQDRKDSGATRLARVKSKLGKVFEDDFSSVTLKNWSQDIDDLKSYKDKHKKLIKGGKGFEFTL